VARKASRALTGALLLIGMTSWVEAGPTAAAPPAQIVPIFECAFPKPGGSGYVTVWGYENDTGQTQSFPAGAHNRFLPAPDDRGQPVTFASGRHDNVLLVNWDGREALQWKIDNTTVRAATTPVCKTNPVPLTGTGLSTVVAVFVLALLGVGLNARLYLRRRVREL
jgi:hypothetical protein